MTASTRTLLRVALAAATATVAWARAETPAGPAVETAPAPKVRASEAVFDAGTVPAGTVVRHAFVFTNAGMAPITVRDVVTSCECTTIEMRSTRVEPGQEGVILVQFDSTGFAGEVAQSIAVATDDPTQPQTVLTVKAKVSRPIEISPAHALFTARVGAQASETKVIRITNRTSEPLVLQAPETAKRAFAVELTSIRPGEEFELRVTTLPPLPLGTLRDRITLRTNLSHTPKLTIEAVAVVQPPPTPAR